MPLFADSGVMVKRYAWIQFWKPKFCLQKICTRSQQICICLFKLHTRVLGPNCWGWPMCSIRGRYWNCGQKCHGSYPEHSGSLQVPSPNRIEIDNWKVQLWSRTSWIPRQNHFNRRGLTTNLQNLKLLRQFEIPKIEKGFAELSGVRTLLQKLTSKDGWKT